MTAKAHPAWPSSHFCPAMLNGSCYNTGSQRNLEEAQS